MRRETTVAFGIVVAFVVLIGGMGHLPSKQAPH